MNQYLTASLLNDLFRISLPIKKISSIDLYVSKKKSIVSFQERGNYIFKMSL